MVFSGDFILNVYTFFLAVMLLLFQENDKKSESNMAFLKLVGILAMLVGVSALGDFGKQLGGDWFALTRLSSYFAFAFDPLGFLFSISYIDKYTEGVEYSRRRLFILPLRLYAVINFAAVTVSSIFNLRLFYYYVGNEYFRGSMYVLRGLLHVALCIVVMTYVVVFRKNINRNYRLPIVMFPLIVALGGFLQVVVLPMNIEYAATVFACLILFIYVQKRDVNLDYLTGVVNRRGIDTALKRAIIESRFKEFSAVMIDVDYFKAINDRFGHKAGDEVLENIACAIRDAFNPEDIIGRLGGDEFCVITGISDEEELMNRIAKVREVIASINWTSFENMDLSISAGVAVYNKDSGMDTKEFLEAIDKRMYEEKLRHHIADRRAARG